MRREAQELTEIEGDFVVCHDGSLAAMGIAGREVERMRRRPVEECRDVDEEDGGRESYLYPARPIDELAVAHRRLSRHFSTC